MMQVKRNYNTYLTQELDNSSTGEFPIYLQDDLDSDQGFLLIDTGLPSTESIFYHRAIGSTAYAYYFNRSNPAYHAMGSQVLMANSVDYINYLLNQTGEQFYIYQINANHLVCKGGTIYVNGENITVNDLNTSSALPNKTLVSNATNYLYFYQSDFHITTTPIALEAYLIATIFVNVGGEIANLIKHNTKIVGNKGEKGDQGDIGPVGPAGADGADGITPTVPPLPTYTFTGSTTDRDIDIATATVGELYNAIATMYNDIKIGLQVIGIQGPAGVNGTNGTNGIGIPTGGTTGQILQKASTTDYDTNWYTPSGVGDMVKTMYDPTNKNQDIFAYPYSKAEADALLATKQPTIGYTPANDLMVVHTTGNEPIYGTKTFSNIITNGLTLPMSPAVGKVLTSDASGNATWQNIPTSSSTGYFYLTKTGTDSLPQNVATPITWNTIRTSSGITLTPTLTNITLPAGVWQVGGNVLRTISPGTTLSVYIQLDSSTGIIDTVKLANSSGINLEQFGGSVTGIVVSTGSTTVQILTYHQWGGTQTTQDICGFWGIKIA